MQSVEVLVQRLRQRGLKVTPQRRAILSLLAGDSSHPTAEQVFRRVASAMPDISRTTVYNTIHELVALGELAEVANLSEAGTRYDTNTADHHHLFCVRCHTLKDIHADLQVELAPEELAGYQVLRRQVTFYGHCPQCQIDRRRKTPKRKGGAAAEP